MQTVNLRNPMLIHKIQDNLCAVQGNTMMREIIRQGAVYDLSATIEMIRDQVREGHRVAIVDMIGETTMVMIDELVQGPGNHSQLTTK
jgi:adenine/guanine phosphoribosyltransferase-like PRPP-binding protein